MLASWATVLHFGNLKRMRGGRIMPSISSNPFAELLNQKNGLASQNIQVLSTYDIQRSNWCCFLMVQQDANNAIKMTGHAYR